MTTDANSGDVYNALKIAGKLRFQPGASKTLVLIRCSSQFKDQNNAFAFRDALAMLKEQQITLHYLNAEDIAFKSRRKTVKL